MSEGDIRTFLQALVVGVSTGSAFALVGISFVLIYRTTNIINFALGEVDDVRRPVDEHERDPHQREGGAGRDADDERLEERADVTFAHVSTSSPPPRYAAWTSEFSRSSSLVPERT